MTSGRRILPYLLLPCLVCALFLPANRKAYAGADWQCQKGQVHAQGRCANPDKPPDDPCRPKAGDPVDILSGTVQEEVVDWSSGGTNPLELKRYYSSSPYMLMASNYSMLGTGWRSNFDARLSWTGAANVWDADSLSIALPAGHEYTFTKRNGLWIPVLPVRSGGGITWQQRNTLGMWVGIRLEVSGLSFNSPSGIIYDFDDSNGNLKGIRYPGGYWQRISYAGDAVTVQDKFGRTLSFALSTLPAGSKVARSVTTPDGTRIDYAYVNRFPSLSNRDYWALSRVTFPGRGSPAVNYRYADDASKPAILLSSITDERGQDVANWTYDGDGRAITNSGAGRVAKWTFDYDPANNRVTTTNPLGRKTIYTYQQNGGLRQVMSVDGVATGNCLASNSRYEYDSKGYRSRAVDAEGRVTAWTRDELGRPLTIVEAAGTAQERTTKLTWRSWPQNFPSSVEKAGLTTTMTYDRYGRLTGLTQDTRSKSASGSTPSEEARTTTMTYWSSLDWMAINYDYVFGPLGPVMIDGPLPGKDDTTSYSYDIAGFLSSITDEVGHVTIITSRDGSGRPLAVRDPNGVITSYSYDPRGRLSAVTVSPGPQGRTTSFTYDAAGYLIKVQFPDRVFITYERNAPGWLVAIKNNLGEKITYDYNKNGDVTARTVRSARGSIVRTQTFVSDELGRLLRVAGSTGQATVFGYDRADRPISATDPRGGITTLERDALGQLAAITNPAGETVRFTRDLQGNIVTHRDPRNILASYAYNGFGEVTRENSPDFGETSFNRDQSGRITSSQDPRGILTNLTYDAAGRVLAERHPSDSSEDISYSYDATANGNKGIGHLTGLDDSSGSTRFYYDDQGNLRLQTQVIAGRTYFTGFSYNAAGRLISTRYPSGRVVNYARDSTGRISAVTTRQTASAPLQNVATGIAWSPMSSLLTALTHANGLSGQMTYDADGRISSLAVKNGSASVISLDYGYGYGDGLNLTAITDRVNAANSVTLGYDPAQRLQSAAGPWGTLIYSYTGTGDRLSEIATQQGVSISSRFYHRANSNRPYRIKTGRLISSPTYDASGNLLTDGTSADRRSYSYDLRNRLESVTRTGPVNETASYRYNALDQMVSRSTSTRAVHFIYGPGGELLAEADAATGVVLREYLWLPAEPALGVEDEEDAQAGAWPIAQVINAGTASPSLLSVHADHLRRPVMLTDSTKAPVWQAVYKPFGETFSMSGTVEQNLRLPGQYFLAETGLA